MSLILALVALLVVLIKSISIFYQNIWRNGEWQWMDWFAAFTLMTAPMFFSPVREVKYFWWFILVFYLLIQKQYTFKLNSIILIYLILLIYAVFGLLFGGYWVRGGLSIIKYLLIFFFFIIGYNINADEKTVVKILSYGMVGIAFAFFLAGGHVKLMSSFVYSYTTILFFGHAGLSDCFSSFSPICLALFMLTGEKKYIWLWMGLFLSAVLFVVRTGIGGFILATIGFSLIRFRMKVFPILIFMLIVLFGSVIYIKPVREKMFFPEVVERIEKNGPGMYLFNEEVIQTSGRSYLVEVILKNFKMKDHFYGYGTGALNTTLRAWNRKRGTSAIAHNDYLTIYIDHGILGLSIWILVLAGSIFSIYNITKLKACSRLTRILGMTAAGSIFGVSFAMGFDNVISHLMSSIGPSFLLYGMFVKSFENDQINPPLIRK